MQKSSVLKKSTQWKWYGMSLLFFIWGLTTVVWLNSGWAAPVPAPFIEKDNCPVKIHKLMLSGDFTMPQSGERMEIQVGLVRGGQEVSAVILPWKKQGSCEAMCRVERLERYQKDQQPALLEMSCESRGLKALRSPLHIQWVRNEGPKIRMGSALYGVEEAPLRLELNRYAPSQKIATSQ